VGDNEFSSRKLKDLSAIESRADEAVESNNKGLPKSEAKCQSKKLSMAARAKIMPNK